MDNGANNSSQPDHQVDTVDLVFFANEFRAQVPPECHDYDFSGVCDTVDLTIFSDAFEWAFWC